MWVVDVFDLDLGVEVVAVGGSSVDSHIGGFVRPQFGVGADLVVVENKVVVAVAASYSSFDFHHHLLADVVVVGRVGPVDVGVLVG